MIDIWNRLKSEARPILLYGSGNGAQKIYGELQKNKIAVSGIFASDGFKKVRKFNGFDILTYSVALEKYGDFVALFAFGSNTDEVLNSVKMMMKNITVLCAEMPVCDERPFNLEFAKQHSQELYSVYSMLADEQSKKVFEQTVLFKLDGDINRLFACESSEDEAFENILKIKECKSFLDLGAYNGDTALDFARRAVKYFHITAVEPDKKTFDKLLKNTRHLNIDCINAAIGQAVGSVPFTFKANRGSVYGGEDKCDCVNIDSLNTKFDYIKFDVEGQELAALQGGKKTITEYKPKMLVSAYHRIEDYFQIPIYIKTLRPDYKVYMRHYPYIPAWDTQFYFV